MDETSDPQNNGADIPDPDGARPQSEDAVADEGPTAGTAVETAVSAGESTAQDEADADADAERKVPQSAAPDNPLRVLEALLFASDEILTTERIKAILPGQPDGRRIRQLVEAINVRFARERHPFEVVEIGGGYQFRTVSYYYPWVVQLFKEKSAKKLSIQSLECLAIIAYKQPITKAEIEQIRGVLSDGAMKTLLEKRLVTISGRSEKPGRPLLYVTTKEFLVYFGINKIADLPRIEEFEAMAKEKLGELTETELQSIEAEKTQPPQDGTEPPGGADRAAAPEPQPLDQNAPTDADDTVMIDPAAPQP